MCSASTAASIMRRIQVNRPWSFKTKNGRWSVRPGEQALVPTEVAIAAQAQAVLRTPEIDPQLKGGEDNASYP